MMPQYRPADDCTIPASVMDAVVAAGRRFDAGDRGRVMTWCATSGRRDEAAWLLRHPADYGRLLDALPYWRPMEATA